LNGVDTSGNVTTVSAGDSYIYVVAFVCLAFSCELIMKALILYEKNEIPPKWMRYIHELDALTEKLNVKLKKEIEHEINNIFNTERMCFCFKTALNKNSEAFIKLRYFYEQEVSYDIKFLEKFNNVLFIKYESTVK
jgi:hypothetical protein